MTPNANEDLAFRELFSQVERAGEKAPPSLKARLYSAFIHTQETTGPLASLDTTAAAGHGICVFEKLVQIAPVGERTKSLFFCQVCHARILGEKFDTPPTFWPHCPYVEFRKP